MDLLEIKSVARKLKILDVWLDVENFLRHNPLRNEKLFLPWNEFESKAELTIYRQDHTASESLSKLV